MKHLVFCLLFFGWGVEASDWHDMDVVQLQKKMAQGQLTALELTQHHLQRIKHHDGQLNAVIAINPDAKKIAKALDKERKKSGPRSPLHGIPVLLKDNIESKDDMATTAGSLFLKDNVTGRDAHLVKELRAAGAVILGKVNLSEWAGFRALVNSSGWSGIKGQTHNAYDLNRNPCGSSSGSAAAMAAGFATLTVGTETNGSITCPASLNGVVGLKPTVGLVSRTHVVPLASSQDSPGPITKSVTDAAHMLTVMQGADPKDPAFESVKSNAQKDYTQHLKKDGLKGKRIGVFQPLDKMSPANLALLNQAVNDMKTAGAEVIEGLEWSGGDQFQQLSVMLLLMELKHELNAYLADLPNALAGKTLEDLIAFNVAHKDKEMKYFDQQLLQLSQQQADVESEQYQQIKTLLQSQTREKGIDALMAAHDLDVIVAPTVGPAWMTDWIYGDKSDGNSSFLAAIAGYPNITVPMGNIHGMPVGLSIFSGAFQEAAIIEVAYAYEQLTQHRVKNEKHLAF